MPWLVDNTGFQRDMDTHDNVRLVQDTAHYLEHTGQGGLLILADQKAAYPRTQWGFLQKVMARMEVHPDFRAMVAALYRNPAVHIKVNGHVGEPFRPEHALHQGCGLSPLLYLLCLQTFTSLVARDGQLQGVAVPGRGGRGEREIRGAGYADDLAAWLRDETHLPRFKELLSVYERGSGAKRVE